MVSNPNDTELEVTLATSQKLYSWKLILHMIAVQQLLCSSKIGACGTHIQKS